MSGHRLRSARGISKLQDAFSGAECWRRSYTCAYRAWICHDMRAVKFITQSVNAILNRTNLLKSSKVQK